MWLLTVIINDQKFFFMSLILIIIFILLSVDYYKKFIEHRWKLRGNFQTFKNVEKWTQKRRIDLSMRAHSSYAIFWLNRGLIAHAYLRPRRHTRIILRTMYWGRESQYKCRKKKGKKEKEGSTRMWRKKKAHCSFCAIVNWSIQ